MIHSIDRRTFEATMRLAIPARTEFLGVHHHPHTPPTATLRVGPVDLELSLADVDEFVAAAQQMQQAARQARERAEIAREPRPTPTPAIGAGSPA